MRVLYNKLLHFVNHIDMGLFSITLTILPQPQQQSFRFQSELIERMYLEWIEWKLCLYSILTYFIKYKPYPLKDRKSTRLNSSHMKISYAVFCLKKKNRTGHAEVHASLHPNVERSDD